MVAELCGYTQNLGILYFKWVNYMECELYISVKLFLKNHEEKTPEVLIDHRSLALH